MQDATPALPQWAFQILYGLASLLGGGLIVRLLTLYQNRKKPLAEVHEIEARASEITVRAHSTAGDAVIRFMDRLDEAQHKIDQLKRTIEKQETEIEFADKQIKKMKALMDIHNVKYSEFDER